jgi:hypothetical protein
MHVTFSTYGSSWGYDAKAEQNREHLKWLVMNRSNMIVAAVNSERFATLICEYLDRIERAKTEGK